MSGGKRRAFYHWFWDYHWHCSPPIISVYGNSYENRIATFTADEAGFKAAYELLDDLRSGRITEEVALNNSLKAMARIE